MTDDEAKELDLTIAGQHVRTKGYRLLDLIWLPMVLGIAWICMTLYTHQTEAQTIANKVADVLEKSNANIARVLKESGDQHAQAVKEMAIEQKKATAVLQEMTCLLDPALKNRPDARQICERLVRNHRDDRR